MDERSFLYDGERLLCNMRASPALLCRSLARAALDALLIGAAINIVLIAAAFALGWTVSPWVFALPVILGYGVAATFRWRVWKHARFRVTTDRILVQTPTSFLHPHLTTIKWSQYQESYAGHRGVLDILFRSRGICFRYGTADGNNQICFPSITFAQDLKHYLDKVDSAVRKNAADTVQAFVLKKRGKRDLPGSGADQGAVHGKP
jgi:hypothetical protein